MKRIGVGLIRLYRVTLSPFFRGCVPLRAFLLGVHGAGHPQIRPPPGQRDGCPTHRALSPLEPRGLRPGPMSHVRAFVSAAARLAPIDLLAAIVDRDPRGVLRRRPGRGPGPDGTSSDPRRGDRDHQPRVASTPAGASQDPATAAPPESVAPARTAAAEAASAVAGGLGSRDDDHGRLPGPAGIVQVRQQWVG